ncbi:MAG: hypothetical protein JRI68_31975 [Deltaproteobacteria bacterium]|nr:hypothetical protein [Deltaproteobacteria bacterium]
MAVVTKLPVEELGLALAIHCKLFGENPRVARRHLDLTPRSHFDEGCAWAESNAKLIGLIRSDPKAVRAGSYSLNAARGWFARLIGMGRSKSPSAPTDDELERVAAELGKKRKPVDEEKARKMAALRELVDDSFERTKEPAP